MSPRTSQQFKEIREEKKALIMGAALEQFANEGYYRTTISNIARHAGISKGLMYNYFESKEALLQAIVEKSVNEATKFFDINRDGYLTEKEFVFFVRKIPVLLNKERSFWRLLMQLLVQKDVREQLIKTFHEPDVKGAAGKEPGSYSTPLQMRKIIADYFFRKKERLGGDYDPVCELNLFFSTLMGYAVKNIYSDKDDHNKMIERIIEMYK